MNLLCELYNEVEMISYEEIGFVIPNTHKNRKKFPYIFNKRLMIYKKCFTDKKLKNFFENNVKNNYDAINLFKSIDFNDLNMKITKIAKFYSDNIVLLFKKTKLLKLKTKIKFDEIQMCRTNVYGNFCKENSWIKKYIKNIIKISYYFYEINYKFYYSEYIYTFCSLSLYNRLFKDFPFRFF